jgi:hypothetical protein
VADPTGCLNATCSGISTGNIKVTVTWCSTLAPTHSVQKGDMWPSDSGTFWDFLPYEGSNNIYEDVISKVGLYSGANYLQIGNTYSYRIKYETADTTLKASNVISIPITSCFCSP